MRDHSSLSIDCRCSGFSICFQHWRYFIEGYIRLESKWLRLEAPSRTCDGRVELEKKLGEFNAGVVQDSVSHLNELSTYAKSSLTFSRSRMTNGTRFPNHLSWPRWLMLAI